MHAINTHIICIFSLGFVYATLKTIGFFFPRKAIGQNVLPAYPNPNVIMKINTQTMRLPNVKALPLLRSEQSITEYRIHNTDRILKLTKREQDKQLIKQARKK